MFKSRCFLRQGTLVHFVSRHPSVQMGTGGNFYFYAHFKMAATYRCRLVVSTHDLVLGSPEELAFASRKNASLLGFKLVQTGLSLPQF